jgi:hypothetical protein
MKNTNSHLMLPGFFLAIVLVFPSPVSADSIRCGRKVIRSGDSSAELMQKCGEPQSRDSAQEELWLNRTQQKVRVGGGIQARRQADAVVLVYRGGGRCQDGKSMKQRGRGS